MDLLCGHGVIGILLCFDQIIGITQCIGIVEGHRSKTCVALARSQSIMITRAMLFAMPLSANERGGSILDPLHGSKD